MAKERIQPVPWTEPTEPLLWNYNVYATPFVQNVFRSINTETPLRTVLSPSRHLIDYKSYIASFAGGAFLPKSSATTNQVERGVVGACQLSPQSYHQYFDNLFRIECVAREQENEGLALYQVPLLHGPSIDTGKLWTLAIPGLREDNPFIEMGDILQIRQLYLNDRNNQFYEQAQSYSIASQNPDSQISWSGIQHDATVFRVNRAEELVYLEADALMQIYHAQLLSRMIVNVILPLKQRAHLRVQRALSTVSSVLRAYEDIATNKGELDADDQRDELSGNDWTRRMLFPVERDGTLQRSLRSVPHCDLFDAAINYEQAHTVRTICKNDFGVLPYLISGPPGTGKTKTLVEVAMQLLRTTDVAHILICAPSEAAADTLAMRLKKYLSPKQLLRLNRPNRADNEVPGELSGYCFMRNSMFYLPPFRKLMAYNVVVASCQDASILAEARLSNSDLWTIERNVMSAFHPEEELPTTDLHWGALLMDEAAQATELDILPALSVVFPPAAYPNTMLQPRFVMAGDENQLGPKTASRNPAYSTSLFARLFNRPLYKDHPLSRANIKPSSNPPVLKRSMLPIITPPFTNLIRNYRSHPSILSISSSLFYADSLIPEAPIQDTPLQRSPFWRGRKWPVLFLPNNSPDEIERDGGGWYNLSEARLACNIAQQLVQECGVKEADICIMSPFAAQVKCLRERIRGMEYGVGKGLWYVNIGPLEAFQGLESRVVILCTTRTRERFVAEDQKRGFGIIGEKRRMNVALTRAKEGLFVIGNPTVLVLDECWRAWMEFCKRNGLVHDPLKIWETNKDDPMSGRIGVLERALIAHEESRIRRDDRALGKAAAGLDVQFGGQSWEESLRAALGDNEIEDWGEVEGWDENGHDASDEAAVF